MRLYCGIATPGLTPMLTKTKKNNTYLALYIYIYITEKAALPFMAPNDIISICMGKQVEYSNMLQCLPSPFVAHHRERNVSKYKYKKKKNRNQQAKMLFMAQHALHTSKFRLFKNGMGCRCQKTLNVRRANWTEHNIRYILDTWLCTSGCIWWWRYDADGPIYASQGIKCRISLVDLPSHTWCIRSCRYPLEVNLIYE